MAFKIGNAPCSWGVYYPQGNTLTGAEYLDAVARAGYRYTELGPFGYLGTQAGNIRQMLDARGLTLTGAAHVHTLADAATAPALTATLRQIGPLLAELRCPNLILMDESEWYAPGAEGVVDAAGWQMAMQMIRNAQDLLAREYGVTLFVHPHVGTCIEREAQIDRLLAETDVSLCFDTGHHAFWDQDVLAYMGRVWDRIGYIHLKNVDAAVRAKVLDGRLGVTESYAAGVMCPLPSGAVDIGTVLTFLAARDFQGFCIVEQDLAEDAPLSPEDLARINLEFLNSLPNQEGAA